MQPRFFHRNISLLYCLLSVRSFVGSRWLIPVVLLGEDADLGGDPPVIRTCRSFLESGDQYEKETQLFTSTTLAGLCLGHFTLCCYLPVVLGMHGSTSNSPAIILVPPLILTSFKTDGSPLSVFVIFITTFLLGLPRRDLRSSLATVVDKASAGVGKDMLCCI